MIVKICGIRSLEDALAAVDAGADMLGFNFYEPSPRYIAPAACAELLSRLRDLRPALPRLIGVFVNHPAEQVLATLDGCRFDYAQLSGDEAAQDLDRLRGRAFKAIRPHSTSEARSLAADFAASAPALLLDASNTGLYGGSGSTANWATAAALAARMPIMLAGGLTPDNVAEAVRAVRPWAVDVASGVESAPGAKDAAKMKLFVERAKDPSGQRGLTGLRDAVA